MKITTTKNKTIVLALASLLLFCAVAAIMPAVAGEIAPKYRWTGETVVDKYQYGQTFVVPDRQLDGVQADVSHTLVFPDGTSSYADEIKLELSGKYKLTYTAKADGKVYSESHDFSVDYATYSVKDKNSSAVYKTPDNVRDKDVKGVVVSLAQKDTFTVNQAIAVSDLTADNYFVEGFVINQMVGSGAFTRFIVTLTDFENPDVYIKIIVNERISQDDKGVAFAAACGNGQKPVGLENYVLGTLDNITEVHKNDGLGQWINMPLRGQNTIVGSGKYTYDIYNDDYPFRFSYDPTTQQIWHATNFNVPSDKNYNDPNPDKDKVRVDSTNFKKIVTDLDDSRYYESLWSGFKSGYVRLSITAENYTSTHAQFCITKVAGVDLSNSGFEVKEQPTITIDTDYDVMPEAVVGKSYPVPKASAYDLYGGNVDVTAKVWYNYTSDNKTSVSLVDGKFVAKYAGHYAIVYTATGGSGITAQKVLWVHANAKANPMAIDVSDDRVTSAKAGEFVPYAKATTSGGNGNIQLSVFAKNGDVTLRTDGGFRPEKAGTWQVVYTAVDYVGNSKTVSYDVTVTANTAPVLVDNITLPQMFVSEASFTLPRVFANKYDKDGVHKILCTVRVEYDGKTEIYDSGENFVPKVATDGETIKVTYLCEGAELFSQQVPCVVIYEEGYLKYENYFVATNATGEKSSNDGYILTATSDGAISVTYANALVAEQANFVFRCFGGVGNYTQAVITLTDAANSYNAVQAVFRQVDGKVWLFVEGKSYRTDYSFVGDAFDISLDFADNAFVYDGMAFAPTRTASGDKFVGFSSDKVYLSVELSDAKAGNKFSVMSLRKYKFEGQDEDLVRPYIVINGEVASIGKLGDIIHMPSISVGDVICPNVTVLMQVFAPDGSFVKDVNGMELNGCDAGVEYDFVVEQSGAYKVVYIVKETELFLYVTPFENEWTYEVAVYDSVEPTINVTASVPATVKLGEKVLVPEFTVNDDFTSADNLKVYMYLTTPTGQKQLVTKQAVVCKQKGTYKFTITAIDEAGNIGTKTIYFEVV